MLACKPINWHDVRKKIVCREDIALPAHVLGGETPAHNTLRHFLANKLEHYDTTRNDIAGDGQSNLSAFIAHGNISRRRIVLSLLTHTKQSITDAFDSVKNGSNGEMGSVAAFIEECVVRAELSENFCYYNKNYDMTSGFPTWAKEAHKKARTDKREYTYTLKQFEEAKTHDDLWNAAQLQLVHTGKMHGYLRMYWAKKILEWTTSVDEALHIAITLNDLYELDGRDPNGYVGCAWSIGGLHDRPWFPRPIFGTIRYMAYSGVEKRGDVKKYIATWLNILTKN
jgi:deoxyribodipyrimidine photo-lyase